ncbi:hypothetical protein NM688_g8687 [Phlebia brevispora]|uniref:Uncharacterized protein n=1 Tax=Phlebia brevispora TaxID=194682 RepID=A0ACC1RNX5_9APHY|nr:hypothetical protein NM688_g8687 [Phlebia brevispora]
MCGLPLFLSPSSPTGVMTRESVKRRRTDTSYTQHESLWFDDGNIVLITEDAIGFRVHKSVLSQASPVFKEMFTLPQPDVDEIMEDCHALELQDGPTELADFLTYIYNAGRLYEKGGTPSLSQITAMLKLGLKYQADRMLEEALFLLEEEFPGDLKRWESVHKTRAHDMGELFALANGLQKIGSEGSNTTTLTRVLYECAQAEPEQLISGSVRSSSGKVEVLIQMLQVRCLSAQTKLTRAWLAMYSPLITEFSLAGCANGGRCYQYRYQLNREFLNQLPEGLTPNVLEPAKLECLSKLQRTCPNCSKYLFQRITETQTGILSDLEKYCPHDVGHIQDANRDQSERVASHPYSQRARGDCELNLRHVSELLLDNMGVSTSSTASRRASSAGTKRRRTEDVEDFTEYQKHEKLWFDDGNIVLISERTVAFRVHASILSNHSPVFKDMCAMPQPSETERMEDCPVVHLQDHPLDLEYFLDYIYHGNRIYTAGQRPRLENLVAMLDLGSKYQVDLAHDEAVYQLKRIFPETISTWNTPENFPIKNMAELFILANALQRVDLEPIRSDLLTRVLYLCTQATAEQLVNGATDPDNGRSAVLTPTLLTRCLSAQKKLMRVALEIDTALFSCPSTYVCRNDKCKEIMKDRECVTPRYLDNLMTAQPLGRAYMDILDVMKGRGLCGSCAYKKETELNERRRTILEQLFLYV